MNKYFERRSLETNPKVVTSTTRKQGDDLYVSKIIEGAHYRVIPNTGKEVSYIQTLECGYAVWAPWEGDGVIIRNSCMPKNDSRN